MSMYTFQFVVHFLSIKLNVRAFTDLVCIMYGKFVFNFKLYFCVHVFLLVSMICLTNIVKARQFLIRNKPKQKNSAQYGKTNEDNRAY